jgi:5,10-methylenetetrahydromethanopterin reductase
MKVSLQLIPDHGSADLLAAARVADELGYYACYSADEIYHKDAWLLLGTIASVTERVRLGPCAAPVLFRDPTHIAQLAATLDELSGGRAEVVLGIGNLAMLGQYGIDRRGAQPLARLREAHNVIRTLLDEGSIDFAGDFFRYSGVTTAARPVQSHIPLMIGAMGGPRSMELAGELADGLHTACAYSTEALRFADDAVARGARAAERSLDGFDMADSLLGAIAPDGEVARRAGRTLAAFYLPSMPEGLLARHGIEPEDVRPVNDAFAAGDVARAIGLTSDEIADRIVVAGTPDDWLAWLTKVFAPSGFGHALVSFADPFLLDAWAGVELAGLPDLAEQVRQFGEHVLPRLSAAGSSGTAARTP